MAYLGNTLINGSLRCLNKAYFNDLSIGSDVEIAGKTTTNQLLVNSSNNPSSLSSTNSSTGNIPVIIGNPTGRHIAIDADEIAGKKGVTSVDSLWINYGGGTVYLSTGSQVYADNGTLYAPRLGTSTKYIPNAYITTLTSTTSNVTTLNASTGTVQDLEVKNVLKSFKWDISNVANLANDFMVAPTIEIATDGKVSVSKSGSDYIFTFADSNTITSDEFAGCKWLDGSKVRFTTKINDKLFSDVYGTVTGNMNTNSGRLAVKTSLTEDDLTGISMNTSYDAVGSTIMLYAITKTGDTNIYPVGIHMTAYGTNNSYYIDMYGGNSPSSSGTPAQPVFRIGNLGGITYNEQTLPTQWGVYTYNGYFEGAVVAKEGKIGEWIIDSKKIYTGTWGSNNSAMMSPGTTSTDGNKSIGGSDSMSGWTFTSGANFGVTKEGALYANKGKIGNWTIETDRLHIGDIGDTTSVVLSTGVASTVNIGGSGTDSHTWVFTAGNKFGVTNNGVLYANDVNVTGAVNASTLHVGNSSSTNHLIYENNAIDLETDWLRFDKDTSSVIIGKNRNPKVVIDGKNFYMRNTFDDNYFNIGDHRVDGLYSFTSRYPDVLIGEEGDDDNGNYVSLTRGYLKKYGLTILDSENKNTPIPINKVTSGCCYSNEIVPGKKYFAIYTTDSPMYSMQFINSNKNIGVNAVSFSVTGVASGKGAFNIGEQTKATGAYSFAEGYFCEATNIYTHVEGYFSHANGLYSHAEGSSTANGECSHSEGHSWANGVRSHGEGYVCFADGDYSHAEGKASSTRGEASHAEGWSTSAYGDYSHAEGIGCYARGEGSHAEGYRCEANGKYSHAGGIYTFASRDYQTVIGKRNKKTITVVPPTYCNTTILCKDDLLCSEDGNDYVSDSGDYAFIIGNGDPNYLNLNSNALTVDWDGNLWCAGKVNDVDLHCISTEGTLASSNYQTAIGKYNVEDTNNTYALVIGNGTDDDNRSNALTVDWNGNIKIYNPNLTVGTTPSSNNNNMALYLGDKNGNRMGCVAYNYSTSGDIGIILQGYRNVNNTNYYNTLNLSVGTSGGYKVTVSAPAAWRSALGLGNILDLFRVTSFKKTNVSINANGTATAAVPITIPSGFTAVCIVNARCDVTDTTSGTNYANCFVYNSWISGTTANVSIKNVGSSAAKVTAWAYILFDRNTL